MAYKLEWNPSPNFTPGSQTQAIYGQPRSIKFGAGHWWNTPEAGATHNGVVSILKNPARQASAHAVQSDARVTEMVKAGDTAWATNHANPYVYAIEVDPRIMWKWQSGVSTAQRALGNRIFETLAEYIADKRYHNLTWRPHKYWVATQCNPIRWNEVMIRAKQVRAAKDAPPAPIIKWVAMKTPRFMVAAVDLRVYDLSSKKYIGNTIKKGTSIDFRTKTPDNKWLRSAYSTTHKLNHGIELDKLKEVEPPKPEWVRNLKDITNVKLMVLAPSAPIYDLNTGKQVGSPIPQGTWVDIAKQTKVGDKIYLISSYSATNAMPNGILKGHLGVPAPDPEPPKPDPEPEWLRNWQDIEDINMYTRKEDVEVVNLLDGTTTTTIRAKGTEIAIASSTEWMGQKYLITKYSTDEKLPHGIRLVDLDIKPVDSVVEPIPEDPDRTVDDIIRENNSLLKQILDLLNKIWDSIKTKLGA